MGIETPRELEKKVRHRSLEGPLEEHFSSERTGLFVGPPQTEFPPRRTGRLTLLLHTAMRMRAVKAETHTSVNRSSRMHGAWSSL